MEKIDKILIILASVIITLGSGYIFIFPDTFEIEVADIGTPVASLALKKNSVKRKQNKGITWNESFKDQILYPNDQIFVHENSRAVIEYNNGIQIELEENTLVKILSLNNNEDFLELFKGNFNITAKEGSEVDKLKVKIKGKSYEFRVLETESLKISELGKITTIEAKDLLAADTTTQLNQESIEDSDDNILLKSPRNNSKIDQQGLEEIYFYWNMKNQEFKATEIVIARDKDFQEIITLAKLPGTDFRLSTKNVTPGKYYWKLKLKSPSETRESITYSFMIVGFTSPHLVSPKEKEILYIDYNEVSRSVKLEWDENGIEQVLYKLEIIKDENEKTEKSLLQPYYDIGSATVGTYRWRVKVTHENLGETKWSAVKLFEVRNKEIISDMKPTHKSQIVLDYPNQKIKFKWKAVRDFKSEYLIKIATEPDFSKGLKEYKSSKSSKSIPFDQEGIFYWQVISGDIGMSPINGILFKKPPPLRTPRLPSSKTMKKIRRDTYLIDWKGDPKASRYLLEVYRDRFMNKKMFSQEVSKSEFVWKGRRAGAYYFRIQTIDSWGRRSRFSKIAKLKTP